MQSSEFRSYLIPFVTALNTPYTTITIDLSSLPSQHFLTISVNLALNAKKYEEYEPCGKKRSRKLGKNVVRN